jgi:hypothetical protein
VDTPRPSPRTNRTRRVPQAERESEVPHASGANASAAPAFNATGLRAETNYSVTVTPRSANALGYAGVPAAAVQGVTVHPPGAAVSNLRLIRITPTSVFLAWTPVAPPVTTYLVEGFGAPGGAEPPHEVPQPAAPGDAEFEFTGLDTAREYSFRVTARNLHVAGYSAAPFAEVAGVRLIGLPAPVINLRVASITDTSVSIQWDLAPSHPPASVFQVYYREGSLPFATHGLPETALTHENITGLRRGTMIDLKVFAGTLAGYELEGSVVVSAAPVSRPPPPPSRTKWTRRVPQPVLIGHAASLSQVSRPMPVTAVRIVEIAETSITLEWDPARFPRTTSFLLRWGGEGADEAAEAETTATTFTATGLATGVPVTFSIFSRNFNDDGYETAGMSAVVTPIVPPGYVTTLTVTNVTSTSVTLCYSPDELTNVTRAKMQLKRSSAAAWADAEERVCRIDEQYVSAPPSCGTCYTAAGLVTGVRYDFRVLQRNSNQAGYRAAAAQVVSGVPVFRPTRSVSNLRVVGVTTEAVYLEFDEPDGVDKPLAYKVVFRREAGGPEEESMEFPAGFLPVNVSGLARDVPYLFRVIGRNLNADGYAPPPLRTKWTRRVPHPVLIGHATSLPRTGTAVLCAPRRSARRRSRSRLRSGRSASRASRQPRCSSSGNHRPRARWRSTSSRSRTKRCSQTPVRTSLPY